ncbi:MAG: NUDIX domain-containing protein [Candidatus Dormibacteraeota bacterium]|nr:NUDIX domain-containing protein [Candidatus Dormibacteraeota bacterium]
MPPRTPHEGPLPGDPGDKTWHVHGERTLYQSSWLSLGLADVELPDGTRLDHHLIRFPRLAAAAVVVDPARGVLLIHRHRFIPDIWGWEVPAGRVEAGEEVVEAAAREALEETGWRPGPGSRLGGGFAAPGMTDLRHEIAIFQGAAHVGEPEDRNEADRVAWVPTRRILPLIEAGEIPDGFTQQALLLALALGRLPVAKGPLRGEPLE